MAGRQQTDVFGMKGVYVLRGGDGPDDCPLVDLFRQGQLHEDAVYRRVGVELCEQIVELRVDRVETRRP